MLFSSQPCATDQSRRASLVVVRHAVVYFQMKWWLSVIPYCFFQNRPTNVSNYLPEKVGHVVGHSTDTRPIA